MEIYLKIPDTCPYCGTELIIKKENNSEILFCPNEQCNSRLINRLDHFCGKKGLDIKGLSKATLEKLDEWNWVRFFEDLFDLKNHRKEWIQKSGFGEKSVDNILNTIEEIRISDIPLERYISAIGIPLIGSTQAKEIAKHFKDFPEFVRATEEDSKFDFYSIDGLGDERIKSILNFDYTEAMEAATRFEKWPSRIEISQDSNSLKDITVCITGALKQYKNRVELQHVIESRGGKVTGSVSAKTNYLINNDNTSTSVKNTTAQKLNIPILTETEFINKFLH